MNCPACAAALHDHVASCPACGTAVDACESPTGTAPRRTPATPVAGLASGSGPIPSGVVLAGRYRIVGLLGRGGMGDVYRADDLRLDHTVALKFLPPGLESDPERLRRFYNEVRTARQVSHPAVCRVHDFGEAEGRQFLSMELVDGEDLASLLRRIGRLAPDKALEIARQLCAGLAAAHEQGVLHRDLKPANVMLDGRGNVRITDFGLAGLADSFGSEDVRSGTPAYMSPEQLLGREVTRRSDIYSLGALLYELFTGQRPFSGRSLAELTRKHRDEAPIEPSAVVPGLAEPIGRGILACLEKDPQRRPPSASAVAAILAGRDPLEAALAAGETPSPELVAAAGGREGLAARPAWLCLGIVLVLVALFPFFSSRQGVLGAVPVEKSPAALEDRARDLLARLGHPGTAVDRVAGLATDSDYPRWVRARDTSPERWRGLRTGDPPVVQFWYRESPRPLAATWLSGQVAWEDPPADVVGMAGVRYDLRGRLLALYVVPPQVEAPGPAAPAPDWAPLLAEARLDAAELRPVPPTRTPPFFADARVAWEGHWPGQSQLTLRVEAAAHRGRPVWFEIVSPWSVPRRQDVGPAQGGHKPTGMVVLFFGLVIGGTMLAQRNLALGRGDRRGAARLATALVAIGLSGWTLGAHHQSDPGGELVLLSRGAGLIVLVAMLLWLFYLALEPHVRRWRPQTLISWTRLLGGGWRDPVVGRDILIGLVWGAGLALGMVLCASFVPARLGEPGPAPLDGRLGALLGLRRLLWISLSLPVNSTLFGMALLLLVMVVRRLVGRDLLAALLVVALLTAQGLGDVDAPLAYVALLMLLVMGSHVLVLMRFGLLAAITGGWVADLLLTVPQSLDLESWTGSGTAFVVPLLAWLAVLAFRSALAPARPPRG